MMDRLETDVLAVFKPHESYSRERLLELTGIAETKVLSKCLGVLNKQKLIKKCPDENTWSLVSKAPVVQISQIEKPVGICKTTLNAAIDSTGELIKLTQRQPNDIETKQAALERLSLILDPTISAVLIEIKDDLDQLAAITGVSSELSRI